MIQITPFIFVKLENKVFGCNVAVFKVIYKTVIYCLHYRSRIYHQKVIITFIILVDVSEIKEEIKEACHLNHPLSHSISFLDCHLWLPTVKLRACIYTVYTWISREELLDQAKHNYDGYGLQGSISIDWTIGLYAWL